MKQIQKLQQIMNIECKSQATKKIYNFHINSFIKFCNNDVKQEKILEYLNNLIVNKRYKPSSLNLAKYSLIYYFTNIINQQIQIYIPQIKKEKLLPKVVLTNIIQQIIEGTTNFKHKILIELLYSSGLRLGEIVVVKWTDLDFINNTIFIKGKGNKERISKLSEVVSDHLKSYYNIRCNKHNPYVFVSQQRQDTHISKKTVQMVLKNVCKKLNIKINISPHMLRHSFATHLTDKNIDIRVIQELLGHSSPKTTMIYTQVSKARLIDVISPLDYIKKEV